MEKQNDSFPVVHFFAHVMSTPQSFHFVRERCRFLEQKYMQAPQGLLHEADQAVSMIYGHKRL